MAKKVIGFNDESDFERMAKSVRKSENMPAVGSQQRAKYPIGGGVALKRAVVIEIGDYDIHQVQMVGGTFTDDLTTDSLTQTDTTEEAYVAAEFDYNLAVGDIVILAKVSGKYWIVETKDKCEDGYCIDSDFNDPNTYVDKWAFSAPNLPCCPEAGGHHTLTTSDAGVTYESDTFECNSDGITRKWIFSTAKNKLRISPMLPEGNLEYRTDIDVTSCTVKLMRYEYTRFPNREDCGKLPKSVCLNPICSIGTCDGCYGRTPTRYKVTIGAGGKSERVGSPTCDHYTGEFIVGQYFTESTTNHNSWIIESPVKESSWLSTPVSGFTINNTGTKYISVSINNEQEYRLTDDDFRCDAPMTLTKYSSAINPYCVYPETIKVEPLNEDRLEDSCYPTTIAYLGKEHPPTSSDGLDDYQCLSLPYYVEFEVSGVTDNTCNSCNGFNDLYRGPIQGLTQNLIEWNTPSVTMSCPEYPSNPFFHMYTYLWNSPPANDTFLELRIGGSARVTYTGPSIPDFNCHGPNEFTYDSDNGECANWPATITVYPLLED